MMYMQPIEMKKIATHNSATGEQGRGILSWIVSPFSRCQSKTIREQYYAGCRYFDIRVRRSKRGWVCAHGLWTAKPRMTEILSLINSFQNCYVMLTYEGKDDGSFLSVAEELVNRYKFIHFTSVNVKKPVWLCLKTFNDVDCEQSFKSLDGSSWHTYLPLPWLWKKIYHNHPEFKEQTFKMVDFL